MKRKQESSGGNMFCFGGYLSSFHLIVSFAGFSIVVERPSAAYEKSAIPTTIRWCCMHPVRLRYTEVRGILHFVLPFKLEFVKGAPATRPTTLTG